MKFNTTVQLLVSLAFCTIASVAQAAPNANGVAAKNAKTKQATQVKQNSKAMQQEAGALNESDERNEKVSRLMTDAIEQVMNKISKSRCDFEVEGAVEKGKPFNLSFLDLNCLILMNADLNFNVLGEAKSSTAEKFTLNTVVKTKGLHILLHAKKEQAKGRLDINFFSYYNTQTRIGTEKGLEATLGSSINTDLLTIKIHSIHVQTLEDSKNPSLMTVEGTCRTEKTMLNFVTGRFENIPATCFVRGTFEVGKGYKLKVGYLNSLSPDASAKVP